MATIEDIDRTHPMYKTRDNRSLPNSPSDATALMRSFIPVTANSITMQLSYGRLAIPNLVKNFRGANNIIVQQRALIALTDLFHSPQNVSQGIEEDVIPYLIQFLSSENITCRQKSSQALKIISNHAIGRSAIMEEPDNILNFSKQFDDVDDLTRKAIHETLANLTSLQSGSRAIFEFNLFPKLCKNLKEERLDIQVDILKTCYNCIRMGDKRAMPAVAIACDALEIFTDAAKNSDVLEVKIAACECIMMLCFFHECKKIASNSDTINVLISLLGHSNSGVRAAAAGGLMTISIFFDGKRVLVRDSALKLLGKLLDDENELVQLNCIKTITNCAEDYRGRFLLHQSLEKLKVLSKTSPNQHVCRAAKQAIDVISWRP